MPAGENLSVIALALDATPLVQLVMLTLLLLSVLSWAVIIERAATHGHTRRRDAEFEEVFWNSDDLNALHTEMSDGNMGEGIGLAAIFEAGYSEYQRLLERGDSADGLIEGAQRAMRVARGHEEGRLDGWLNFLATVGSTSPYIGLLGTVWGIMNAFLGLADIQNVALAAVAPGIAEALIATAMGLVAAIPAIIAYNRFVSQAEKFSALYQNFAEEFTALLHRQRRGG